MNQRIGIFKALIGLTKYRTRLMEGVACDVRQRYVGSLFGSMWAVLFPVLQMSIYTGLYTLIFKIRPSGLTSMGYVVLVFSGLVPLLAFNEALNSSASSLSANKSLLLNTVFPAELIPLRSVLAAQVTGIIGLIITLVLGYSLGYTSWHAALLVPVFWILLIMFAAGLGWILSLLSLVIKDIQHSLSLVLMLVFILSPFAYTPEMVPERLKFFIYANPLSYFVLSFQKLICYGTWPDPVAACGAAFLSIGSFLLGLILFQKVKHVFFDYA